MSTIGSLVELPPVELAASEMELYGEFPPSDLSVNRLGSLAIASSEDMFYRVDAVYDAGATALTTEGLPQFDFAALESETQTEASAAGSMPGMFDTLLEDVSADEIAADINDLFEGVEINFDDEVQTTAHEDGITFEELLKAAANQPENELVLTALRDHVIQAYESGRIDTAFQMARVIGAMACMHNHMEGVSNEIDQKLSGNDGHGHNDKKPENDGHQEHNEQTCANCRAGLPCLLKKGVTRRGFALAS